MDLQYLSDASGNHTAVVIPIREWEELTKQIGELKKLGQPKPESKPSDFVGSLPGDVADAMHKYVRESRQNWG